jgi:hypothetical protein
MKKITYKTLDQIKDAVTKGATVYWGNTSYVVKVNKWGDYNVISANGHVAFMGNDYKANDFYSIEK